VPEPATNLEEPPPRQPWEEPPAAGWSSQLSGVGIETALFLAMIGITVGAFRLVTIARRLSEGAGGFRHGLAVAAWGAVCLAAAAVLVYVWRRLGGLALLGAMLTDYGRVARLGGRPPVWLDAPPDDALKLAHLSDLHVAESPSVRMVERAHPAGNARVRLLLDHPEIANAHTLLITGDVTDRGSAIAWRTFLDVLEERELHDKTILVPGNHDLALVDVLDDRRRILRTDRFGIVHLANLLKFCEAFAETMGGKEGFVLGDDGEPLPYADAWQAAERAVRPFIAQLPLKHVPEVRLAHLRADLAERAEYRAPIEEAREKLLALFPVAVPLVGWRGGRDAVVFVLNSCASTSRHPATNALGHVGRAQYKRLFALGSFFAQAVKIVALHHHVVRRFEERGRDFVTRIMAKFTVLGDARPLVRFCKREGVRAVMNGHRHLSYQLRLPNGTVLLAAPSSTLGDELADDPRAQFERYDVSPAPDRMSVGFFRTVVRP
jgi:3',5'-cyclic AMP phosphodiesterase CpdA